MFQTIRHAFAPADPNAIRVPVVLHAPAGAVPITLRTMTADDEDAWNEVRWRNDDWLRPWESGDPMHGRGITFNQWLVMQRRNEERGCGIVLLIEHRMRIVGQISIGAITYGAMRTGIVGYWVSQDVAGHGIAPTALAMLADWAMGDPTGPRLHRLEIAILPENARSLAVVRKVGARPKGCARTTCTSPAAGAPMRRSACLRRIWAPGSRHDCWTAPHRRARGPPRRRIPPVISTRRSAMRTM